MSSVCFIDTETTGLDHRRHVPWEVAIITQAGDEYQVMVSLGEEEVAQADPFALDIGRFHERHPQGNVPTRNKIGAIHWGLVAQKVAQLTDGCHLVGAVPWFDEQMLRRLLYQCGHQPRWHHHLIDVETLAVGYLMGYARGSGEWGQWAKADYMSAFGPKLPWSSEELSRMIGIEAPTDEDRHTALGDARWAKRIYQKVMGQ